MAGKLSLILEKMMMASQQAFFAVVVTCLVLCAFPVATKAACSEAAGSDCTAQFESCEVPYQMNLSTFLILCSVGHGYDRW